ncbi:MAG: cadherin-like domain-containing protein [Oscillospiraceae bacterium]|nr:cadherin-like domain-containing protein [Oscillospiraceae bacterium]
MLKKRIVTFALAALCLVSLALPVSAAQVECDEVYCFGVEDFAQEDEALTGICITGLPDGDAGAVMLGSRVLRPGDILAADQVNRMTFHPLRTQEDAQAVVEYLPIYEDRVAPETTMTISIRGKQDKAPAVTDQSFETYKNLPREGKLKASDPEGDEMTYTVIRQPKRGEVIIRGDGSFLYTPNKNKVGTDRFVYTATDSAGNVSREATVTIELKKPTAKEYSDTLGSDCRFEAEWLKNTGLFAGETVNGESCFQPEKPVTRGEYLAMMVKLLQLPMEEGYEPEAVQTAPRWLRPYVAAALRSGLLEGVDISQSGYFEGHITGCEAAMMAQSVLELKVSAGATLNAEGETLPPEQIALACLAENGITLPGEQALTRAQVAQMLYRVKSLAQDAPGMQMIRQ